MFEPGSLIDGRYRVLRCIGIGGMGAVYAVEQITTGRRLALKTLKPERVRNRTAVARFEREARAAAAACHENIVQIIEFGATATGAEGNAPYFVMELLAGESLEKRLQRTGALPVEQAAWIASRVLHALASAHAAGVIHRDLKPDNVMLVRRPDGGTDVKLLDFGVSKVNDRASAAELTHRGEMLGTPMYMSPEQLEAQPDVDHRTDVYGVGALLYRMLTGVEPFSGASEAALIVAIAYQDPPLVPPSVRRPELPADLDAIVTRAMARDREQRFATAAAFLHALAPFYEDASPAPPPPDASFPPGASLPPPASMKPGGSVASPPSRSAERTQQLRAIADEPARGPSVWLMLTALLAVACAAVAVALAVR